MQITWRGDEYEFFPRKIEGGGDKPGKLSNVTAPIFAADTESVQLKDRYEPQCFTFAAPDGSEHIVYFDEKSFAFKRFMEWIIANYGTYLMDHKNAFIYFHNLEYDWLQLVKNDKRLLEMVRIGVGTSADLELFRIGAYRVYLKKEALFTGSAPHFTIALKAGRSSCNIFFRDSFSFFPSSLASVAKDLKLNLEKMDRQEDIGLRDFRTVPNDNPDKIYFEKYAKIDATVTRLAAERIRELHLHAGMEKIRPSSPGYAIALVFAMMDETQEILTGTKDEWIMQLIFDCYRGGRTGGIAHGKVGHGSVDSNHPVSVFDFHSSYPASMVSLPSFNPNMAYVVLDDLRLDNVLAILKETGNAFLRVSGVETDPHYPALITTHNGKLTPVYGEFTNIATTGAELYVGIQSGTLHITEIHSCVVLMDMDDKPTLPFKEFALSSYEEKANSEKGSVTYTAAKLKLNSAYGKLVESRNQTMIGAQDYLTLLPYVDGMEKDFGNYYYQKYVECIDQGTTFDESLDSIMDELLSTFDKDTCEKMVYKMFGDFSISGKIYGRHVIPAAASLITATSRARLCAALKAFRALYWDTDSLFIDWDWEHNPEELQKRLVYGSSLLPGNILPLTIGEQLGALDCEIKNAKGYLAGTKRYYLEGEDDKGNFVIKCAIHGIPAIPAGEEWDKEEDETEKTKQFHKYRKEVISRLACGDNYEYVSKPRPLKAKEAKTAEDIGSFKPGKYESRFHLDERLTWTKTENGWTGTVTEFKNLQSKEVDRNVKEMVKELTRTK